MDNYGDGPPGEENILTKESQTKKILKSDGISWYKRRRYHNFMVLFTGFLVTYFFRTNLSIAIVSMTAPYNKTLENGTIVEIQDFDFTSKFKGHILSASFYGFAINQVLGGFLVSRFGVKWIMALAVLIPSFINILLPFIVQINIYFLIPLRILDGLFSGMVYPCNPGLWVYWAPPAEQSRLVSLTYAGVYSGILLMMFIGGIIADNVSWRGVFIFPGIIGIFWTGIWLFFVYPNPKEDRFITSQELKYLENEIPKVAKGKTLKHPWGSFFLSLPCWANFIAHFVKAWGFFTFLTQLPMFLRDVYKFDVTKTGFLSALPFIFMSLTLATFSTLGDKLVSKNILSVGAVRKLHFFIGCVGQSVFSMLIYFVSNPYAVISLLCLSLCCHSITISAFMVNWLDIAPPHATILLGIGSTLASFAGVIAPVVNGYIVTDKLFSQWMIVFSIIAALSMFAAIFYVIFASGKQQSWVVKAR